MKINNKFWILDDRVSQNLLHIPLIHKLYGIEFEKSFTSSYNLFISLGFRRDEDSKTFIFQKKIKQPPIYMFIDYGLDGDKYYKKGYECIPLIKKAYPKIIFFILSSQRKILNYILTSDSIKKLTEGLIDKEDLEESNIYEEENFMYEKEYFKNSIRLQRFYLSPTLRSRPKIPQEQITVESLSLEFKINPTWLLHVLLGTENDYEKKLVEEKKELFPKLNNGDIDWNQTYSIINEGKIFRQSKGVPSELQSILDFKDREKKLIRIIEKRVKNLKNQYVLKTKKMIQNIAIDEKYNMAKNNVDITPYGINKNQQLSPIKWAIIKKIPEIIEDFSRKYNIIIQ